LKEKFWFGNKKGGAGIVKGKSKKNKGGENKIKNQRGEEKLKNYLWQAVFTGTVRPFQRLFLAVKTAKKCAMHSQGISPTPRF